jgi:hypothetical protein
MVSSSLKLKLLSKKDELITKLKVIDERVVKSAKQLFDFYNMNRVILSGFDIQPNGSLDSQISSYLHYESSVPSIDLDSSEIESLNSLLLRPSRVVRLTCLAKQKDLKLKKQKNWLINLFD